MSDARAELLGRIRSATEGAPPVAIPTGYRSSGVLDPASRVERFCERVQAQRGRFGAYMEVELVNDGPVTVMLES